MFDLEGIDKRNTNRPRTTSVKDFVASLFAESSCSAPRTETFRLFDSCLSTPYVTEFVAGKVKTGNANMYIADIHPQPNLAIHSTDTYRHIVHSA